MTWSIDKANGSEEFALALAVRTYFARGII